MAIVNHALPAEVRTRLMQLEMRLQQATSADEHARLQAEVAELRAALGAGAVLESSERAEPPESGGPGAGEHVPQAEVAPVEVVPRGEVPPGEVVPRGEIPPADVVIARDEVPSAVPGQWDVVDEASWESFPASDPPASAASAGLPDSAHPREEPRRKAKDGSRGGTPK